MRGSTGAAVPNKVVKVCTSAGAGIPCTPLANSYSDITLTTPITQNDTFKTDSNGRYSFYVAPGRYFIQVLQDPFTELVRFPDVVLAYDASGPSPRVDVTSSTYGGGAKCDGVTGDLPSLSPR